MPINLSTQAVRTMNVKLTACFNEGVNDALKQMEDLYSADGTPVGTALDLVYRSPSDTADNAFLYPEVRFDIQDFGAGDGSPEEGIKLYESRLASGNYKGKIIPVNLTDFEDDKVGQFRVVFYKLGRALVCAPLRLIETTLYTACEGSSLTGFDGQPLFSQQHPTKPNESDAGTTANPYVSNDLVQASGLTFPNFAAAYAAFLGIPDESGFPLEDQLPQWLWFDPMLLGQAMDICFMDRPSALSGGGNQWKGKVRPMMVRKLYGTGMWGIADCFDALERPLNYVEREPLKFRGLFTNPEDPIVRERRQLKWQVDGRINAGAGSWRKILRSRPS